MTDDHSDHHRCFRDLHDLAESAKNGDFENAGLMFDDLLFRMMKLFSEQECAMFDESDPAYEEHVLMHLRGLRAVEAASVFFKTYPNEFNVDEFVEQITAWLAHHCEREDRHLLEVYMSKLSRWRKFRLWLAQLICGKRSSHEARNCRGHFHC